MTFIFFTILILCLFYAGSTVDPKKIQVWQILCIAVCVRLLTLWLFSESFSTDLAWARWAGDMIIDRSPVYVTSGFPFFALFGAASIAVNSIINQFLFIKLVLSFVDVLVAYLVYYVSKDRLAGFLYALNPFTIIATTIHGQFDPIPTSLLLITIATIQAHTYVQSMLAYSLAIFTKNWVLLFFLPIFRRIKDKKTLLIVPLIPVASVFIYHLSFHTPINDIVRSIKDYRGVFGVWGIGSILNLINPAMDPSVIQIFRRVTLILYGISALLIRRKNIFEEILISMMCLFAVTVTFGSQWPSWSIPFIVIVRPRGWKLYMACITVYICISFWTDIYPMNENVQFYFQKYFSYVSLPAWLSVIRILLLDISGKKLSFFHKQS